MQRQRIGELLLFLAYTAFILLLNSRHELWRDEIQAWHIVQYSNSLGDLWRNTSYEGHPFLWYAILYLGKAFWQSIQLQELLHITTVLATAAVFIRKAPFHLIAKAAILFGYFLGYEYGILQRNYALGILFLFLACDNIVKEKERSTLSLWLILALFTNVQAAILSILLAAYALLKNRADLSSKKSWILIATYLIAIGIFLWDIFPQELNTDRPNVVAISFSGFESILKSSMQAILPGFSIVYINGLGILGLVVILIALLFNAKDKKLEFAFAALGIIGLLLFWFWFFKPYPRQTGYLWITLVLFSWLVWSQKKKNFRIYALLLPFIVSQLAFGFLKIKNDWNHSVSMIEETAAYIDKLGVENYNLVGYIDYYTAPIGALLNQPIFYPQQQDFSHYIKWTKERNQSYSVEQLIVYADLLKKNFRPKTILISNKAHTELKDKKMASFESDAINCDENYFLYLFE